MGWRPRPRWDKCNRRYHVTIAGKHHNLGRDYVRACRRFAELLRDAGQSPGFERPATVPELVRAWLLDHPGDWHTYCLREWAGLEAETALDDLPVDTLTRLVKYLRRRKNAPQTIRHKLNHALRLCRWAHERHWLAEIPAKPPTPRVPRNPRDVPLARVQAVIEAMAHPQSVRARAVFEFILSTGCRPQEARLLKWSEVDLTDGVCRLGPERHKRRHRARTIYLGDEAIAILDGARQRDGDAGYVFRSRTGQPYTRTGLACILSRRGISVYQLRHTFAQAALDQTSIEDVAALLGHSDLSTVQVYAQVRDQRAKKVARSLTPPMRRVPGVVDRLDDGGEQQDRCAADRPRSRRKPAKRRGA